MDGAGGYSGNVEEGTEGAQRNPQHQAAQKRLQQTQAKVDEVVGVMQMNVKSLVERGQRLEDLDNRADALQQGASQFEQQAGKLKRKYWWKNLKMMLILGGIAVVLLVIIIVWATSGGSDEPHSTQRPQMYQHASTTVNAAQAQN